MTLNLTEEEMLFIRKAVCDKNIKLACKIVECMQSGDKDGEKFNRDYREIGHNVINMIDTLCGIK